jgi:hypothetical protein
VVDHRRVCPYAHTSQEKSTTAPVNGHFSSAARRAAWTGSRDFPGGSGRGSAAWPAAERVRQQAPLTSCRHGAETPGSSASCRVCTRPPAPLTVATRGGGGSAAARSPSREAWTAAARAAAHSRPTRAATLARWVGLIVTRASGFRSSPASWNEAALPARRPAGRGTAGR